MRNSKSAYLFTRIRILFKILSPYKSKNPRQFNTIWANKLTHRQRRNEYEYNKYSISLIHCYYMRNRFEIEELMN